MRRNRSLIIAASLVAVVIASALWIAQPRGRLHNGRTVAAWIRRLPDSHTISNAEEKPTEVLSNIGDDAVPGLIAALREKDFPTKARLVWALNHLPGVHLQYVPAVDRYRWAQMAFRPRRKTAQAAVARLADMLTQPDVDNRGLRDWAANQLAAIGEPAIPELFRRIDGTNVNQRIAALEVIGNFECDGWNENHLMIRDYSVGYYAPKQVSSDSGHKIMTKLRACQLDSAVNVRNAATNALKAFQDNNPLKPAG